jgi:hypothetical protein
MGPGEHQGPAERLPSSGSAPSTNIRSVCRSFAYFESPDPSVQWCNWRPYSQNTRTTSPSSESTSTCSSRSASVNSSPSRLLNCDRSIP